MQTKTAGTLTIWSFVGYILIVYGIIITAMGIYYLSAPLAKMPLADMHPSLWWGSLLLIIGIIFSVGDKINRRQSQ